MKLLGNIPAYYESTHRHYSREGRRVLALGYKLLQASVITESAALKIDRQEIESNLVCDQNFQMLSLVADWFG